MRLVYTATQQPVSLGDTVTTAKGSGPFVVDFFRQPHKPDSEGKVTLRLPDAEPGTGSTEFYVSIIGAKWIEREDRADS